MMPAKMSRRKKIAIVIGIIIGAFIVSLFTVNYFPKSNAQPENQTNTLLKQIIKNQNLSIQLVQSNAENEAQKLIAIDNDLRQIIHTINQPPCTPEHIQGTNQTICSPSIPPLAILKNQTMGVVR
jgi:hypothetical protein